MKTIKGNLIELAKNGDFDVIVHGCNCFCTMGAGIAKGIKAAFPAAFEADQKTSKGDRSKLGTCTSANIETSETSFVVVNAYTQFDYRGSGQKVDYNALRSSFRWIKAHYPNERIGLAKIGAGLAGGDWPTIRKIIGEELDGEDVTLVTLQP